MKPPPPGPLLMLALFAFMYFYGGIWWLLGSLTIFACQCLGALAMRVGLIGARP